MQESKVDQAIVWIDETRPSQGETRRRDAKKKVQNLDRTYYSRAVHVLEYYLKIIIL